MVAREVSAKYQGSLFGVFWAALGPLLLLGLYTFFFGKILKVKWANNSDSETMFALMIFPGLLIFNSFAEILSKAPHQIISNSNFVKKIVFPLEWLPVISVLASLINLIIGLSIWLIAVFLVTGTLANKLFFLPLMLLPLLLLLIGISWILASLSVFFRDIAHIVGLVSSVMLFLSPVFYSIEKVPPALRPYYKLNPLSTIILETRALAFDGTLNLPWGEWLISCTYCSLIAISGYYIFRQLKGGFADVI